MNGDRTPLFHLRDSSKMLASAAALVLGLALSPAARAPPALRASLASRNVAHMARMCDADPTEPSRPADAAAVAAPPPPPPPPPVESLLARAAVRGFDLWGALAEPYAAAAGVAYEPSGPLEKASAFETAAIGFEEFAALLRSQGDELPEGRARAMFDAADAEGTGTIEFVQCYKAILDEARSGGGGGGGLFGGLFGGK
jgi:hypothetical protein